MMHVILGSMKLFLIIILFSQVCFSNDLVFEDVEYDLRARSDKNFLEFLLTKKANKIKHDKARKEHKLSRELLLKNYDKSIKQQVERRKREIRKDTVQYESSI